MSKFRPWYYPVVVMLIIFIISSIPGAAINNAGLGRESYHINGHFVLFLILCVTFYKPTKRVWLSILLTVLYALFDEYHQMFTSLRSSSLFDIYVDTIGALIGGLILWKKNFLPQNLKDWLIS